MPSVSSKTRFKVLQKFGLDYAPHVITKYESERTGMSVVVVDREGPKVNGAFTLATEIHDDSGAPHTLEHLCFMGSKSYPYKGVLDKLATRAYSNTNAWTATDHTAYTLDTAGWEGFAQILPIYLEHVILPTLTDAGCYTEVHHVDGSGHDAGVVYSEMQGVQNTQAELMDLKTKRLLYPANIGFRYETGGMMEQLRVLTADRIRQFHREMYQPKNLCVVLIGTIDHANLLDILDNFEMGIVNEIPRLDAPFKRPWVESDLTPSLQRSVTETVEFPEEDESTGEIAISFLGPKCNDLIQGEFEVADENALFLDVADIESVIALNVLLVYLAGSSASVLENIMVEKECLASAVYYATEIRPDIVIQFSLSGVATERLAEVEARFFDIIRETAAKELDLVYLKNCIKRERLQVMSSAEISTTPFLEPIIYDFLFAARDGSQLKADLESLKEYDELETWSDSDWRQLLRKWISDAYHVTVVGKPSAKLSEKLKAEETARVTAQKESLGVDGLEIKERRLAQAKAENDREIPEEILKRFEIPTTKSINFIKTTTARSGLAREMGPLDNQIQQLIDQDSSALPLFVQFEHIPSNFAHLILVISTEAVPVALRPLLPLYIDNFFTSPVRRNNQRIEFEQVIMELERDTVSYGINLGHEIGNPEVLCLRMQVEISKYASAVQWLKDIIWNGLFDAEVFRNLRVVKYRRPLLTKKATALDNHQTFSRYS